MRNMVENAVYIVDTLTGVLCPIKRNEPVPDHLMAGHPTNAHADSREIDGALYRAIHGKGAVRRPHNLTRAQRWEARRQARDNAARRRFKLQANRKAYYERLLSGDVRCEAESLDLMMFDKIRTFASVSDLPTPIKRAKSGKRINIKKSADAGLSRPERQILGKAKRGLTNAQRITRAIATAGTLAYLADKARMYRSINTPGYKEWLAERYKPLDAITNRYIECPMYRGEHRYTPDANYKPSRRMSIASM